MLLDFENYPLDYNHVYGGHAAQKLGILINGVPYMLKYPNNLKEKNIKNCSLSYSNSPYSEYIGSHIYEILGIPVHKTYLGTRRNHIVVACKNFCEPDEKLMMFSEIKTTFEPSARFDDSPSVTEGSNADLEEILQILDEHPFFEFVRELVKLRFWNMFIIDAYIGNPDRNNENWGLVSGIDGKKRLAPVYDNGNCLSDKWDSEKVQAFLDGTDEEKEILAFSVPSIFTRAGKKIHPLSFILRRENRDCDDAILRIVSRMIRAQKEIRTLVDSAPGLETDSKRFYLDMLGTRYEKALLPAFKEIYRERYGREFDFEAFSKPLQKTKERGGR